MLSFGILFKHDKHLFFDRHRVLRNLTKKFSSRYLLPKESESLCPSNVVEKKKKQIERKKECDLTP
jgi:hypothetical protein